MNIDHNDKSVVEIVSAMFSLVENKGLTPDEVISLVNKIKQDTYEELVEVYKNL